jgi:23S rRNA pseudouridine1911/1915/1917 synthase
MSAPLVVVVPESLAGARVDRAVAELLEIPVNAARRLVEGGRVRVNRQKRKKGDVVRAGETVVVEGVAGQGAWLAPGGEIAILLEDAHVLVVDKPAGMPSHPLVPGEGGTAVDALVARHPEIASSSDDPREGGLVHRLDTGTSGCLAVARDRETWRALRDAFAKNLVDKTYLALVHGVVDGPVVVDGFLAHDPADPRRVVTAPAGQPATTTATPLATAADHSLVSVRVDGGRRHQVRVHLAAAGHPLVGDVLYGAPAADDAPWHLLHADALTLPGHARATAPLPPAFRTAARARGLVLPGGGI